jgi:hypothetical protein
VNKLQMHFEHGSRCYEMGLKNAYYRYSSTALKETFEYYKKYLTRFITHDTIK